MEHNTHTIMYTIDHTAVHEHTGPKYTACDSKQLFPMMQQVLLSDSVTVSATSVGDAPQHV